MLKGLGSTDELALASIRFGLGRWTTEEEVDYVVSKVASVVIPAPRVKAELGLSVYAAFLANDRTDTVRHQNSGVRGPGIVLTTA